MLGVFGCVPALDRYFRQGFGRASFRRDHLLKISAFYEANASAIERQRVRTLDYTTAQPTSRRYTRAKLVNMIFFAAGGGVTAAQAETASNGATAATDKS